MKLTILALGLFIGFSASAEETHLAEYFQVDTWLGEYPTGYQLMDNVEVRTVQSPTNPAANGTCTLKKNTVIHPWAQKTQSEFVTLSGVSVWTAAKDLTLGYEEDAIEVKAGTKMKQLSYLSEGICVIQVGDQVLDDTCFDVEEGRANIVSQSPFSDREFFKTTCAEGHEAWMTSSVLSELVSDEADATVKYAEIEDYGTVKEP